MTTPTDATATGLKEAIAELRFQVDFQRGYGSNHIRMSRADGDLILAALLPSASVGATDDNIERVAKAIYDATHAGLSNCYAWDDEWEPYQEANRERYYKEARAVIPVVCGMLAATSEIPLPSASVGGEACDLPEDGWACSLPLGHAGGCRKFAYYEGPETTSVSVGGEREADQRGIDACDVPPAGWWCSRDAGHDGPCAARPDADDANKAGGLWYRRWFKAMEEVRRLSADVGTAQREMQEAAAKVAKADNAVLRTSAEKRICHRIAATIRALPIRALAAPKTPPTEGAGLPCERCQGNGEIVTDWERYMHGKPGDVGDEGTADCPDCNGTGRTETPPTEGGL